MIVRETTAPKSMVFAIDRFLPLVAFTIPFFISGPQLLTGSLVNCFLFLAAFYSTKRTQLVIITLPSIAALLNGVIFGKFTPFLAYFLPLIWIGNYILVKTFSRKNFVGVILSAFFKSIFLFTFAFIFFKLQIVPQIFLTAMGIFQFVTAIIGGILFLGINKIFIGVKK